MSSNEKMIKMKILQEDKENIIYQELNLNENDSNCNSNLIANINKGIINLTKINANSNQNSPNLKNNHFENMNNNNFNIYYNNTNNIGINNVNNLCNSNNRNYNYQINSNLTLKSNYFENHKTPFKNLIKDLNNISKDMNFLVFNSQNQKNETVDILSFPINLTKDISNKSNNAPDCCNIYKNPSNSNINNLLNLNIENNNCSESSCNSSISILSNTSKNFYINNSNKEFNSNSIRNSINNNFSKSNSSSTLILKSKNKNNKNLENSNNDNSNNIINDKINFYTTNNIINIKSINSMNPQSPVIIKNKIIIVDNKTESEQKDKNNLINLNNLYNSSNINSNIKYEVNDYFTPFKSSSAKKRIFECTDEFTSTLNTTQKKNKIKKRMRKSSHQLDYLIEAYKNNKNWSKEIIFETAKITGLQENKVYKWFWDQKNKELLEKRQGCIFQVQNCNFKI